ncbi:MAG TPA: heavy metal translocating P-type ATPase [Saprospiraceae bacterium]|jgi:Cd2+/Zn2+-exporting ATPase|nr:cadmium-translocating P-type ATPase [Saprospiraceae bacterium]HRO09398.1 heavy metal translocating P-type ATPase [Saprospiraceae bacterium]HRP41589.1 heavy metal translocating P-type ATPase [Saprospiraceae bacterium]
MINTDKNHIHTYDAQGRMTCCSLEDKIYSMAGADDLLKSNKKKKHEHIHKGGDTHEHEHEQDHDHSHDHSSGNTIKIIIPSVISLIILLAGIYLDKFLQPEWFTQVFRLGIYITAYIPVGLPVLKEAITSIKKGEIFSEFLLMGIATIGAFAIGEYPEGVAVMLFYAVGEVFQTMAVRRATKNIQSLLDQRPDTVTVLIGNQSKTLQAAQVEHGAIIQLKPGEKLGLDGFLLSDTAAFNTAALTGESKPDTKVKGETVLAGMINLNTVAQVQVTAAYEDSKLSKILEMVQNATSRKAPTELFIRKFARIYTPVVVILAILICLIPFLFINDYTFRDGLYRALIFLVISCPCALVISIPLGYFGGIGAASRNGILIKGSNYLDTLAGIQHVVMDKTGTLTEGVFKVQDVVIFDGFDKSKILQIVDALERHSSHPVATAIHEYVEEKDSGIVLYKIEEIPGHGLRAEVEGKELLVGNFRLLDKYGIHYNTDINKFAFTVIVIAYDRKLAGYITIADKIKDTAQSAINKIKDLNIKTTMLSGDKDKVVRYVADKLGIDNAYGDLLPEDKVYKVTQIKDLKENVAFVGDGINDAPVVALSDVGIAMGGLGSDATIETADVVIQDDNPDKIPIAIKIGKETKKIVWQNITMAFVVKGIVLILGAGGIATMWEAVFADVGVALLAILNAIRIQRMKF